PREFLVFFLLYGLDLLHEAREVGKLCPLVVGEFDGNSHVDRFDDVGNLRVMPATVALAEHLPGLLLRGCGTGAHYRAHRAMSLCAAFHAFYSSLHSGLRCARRVFGETFGSVFDLVAKG